VSFGTAEKSTINLLSIVSFPPLHFANEYIGETVNFHLLLCVIGEKFDLLQSIRTMKLKIIPSTTTETDLVLPLDGL